MIWLLIGYMWLFVHRPFEIWPALGNWHVERAYMLVTLAWWMARGAGSPKGHRVHLYVLGFILALLATWGQCLFELWPELGTFRIERMAMIVMLAWFLASGAGAPRSNRLHLGFLAFIVALLASWIQCPFPDCGDTAVDNYLKYAIFYVILVTSVRNDADLYRILVGYVGVMTIFMLHSLREYWCGRVYYAQGIARLQAVGMTFDSNDFAGLIVCSMPFVWVLWQRWPSTYKRTGILAYICLSGVCVVLTGSRMGFIGMILAGLLATLAAKHRWRMLALYPVLLAVVWTVLPQEKQDRFMTLLDPSRGPKNAIGSAGNFRFSGFERALPLFAERPLWGFGPQSFGIATGKHLMPHNLYGQLLAELGLAGTIAFGAIVWGIARNAVEAWRLAGGQAGGSLLPWHAILASSAAFLLLLIMAWGFNFLFWHVWLWFGGFQLVALRCLREQAATAVDRADSEIPDAPYPEESCLTCDLADRASAASW
jgi:O-antigen ligase